MNLTYSKKREEKQSFFEKLLQKSAVWWIIIICIIFYILIIILLKINPEFINYFAIKSGNIFAGKYLWTLILHIFSHQWFAHLFFNMFTLYFIGTFTERLIGKKRFILFFLISGIIAGFVSVLFANFLGYGFLGRIFSSPDTFMLGASGAIFGLLGILAILIPEKKVILIAGPLLIIILGSFINNLVINLLSTILLILMMIAIIPSFFGLISLPRWTIPINLPLWFAPIVAIVPLVIIGLFVRLPIGNIAHLFGLITGLVYGFYLKSKYKKKVQLLRKIIR